MLRFRILIDLDALQDIQDATEWYNRQAAGAGQLFQRQVKAQINSLKRNPEVYSERYDKIRCMRIKRFPFLVHYTVSKKQRIVEVFGVLHTSREPRIWRERKKGD